MNVDTECDFGTLPVVAWVRVLEHLPLKDRYHASLVCSNVFEAFSHPSLWRSVTLTVEGGSGKFRSLHVVNIPQRNFHLVQKFGRMFHHITFSVLAPLDESFGEWNMVLADNIKRFNASSLTFDVGGLKNIAKGGAMRTLTENIKPMVDLVRNSLYLKSLVIKSWPTFASSLNKADENVFQAAMDNDKIKNLTKLSIFDCDSVAWSERRPLLLPVDLTHKMVEHFKSLTHLALRSPMLSEDLIRCLSCGDRQRLQQLKISINYLPQNESFEIPQITDSVWRDFTNHNTKVRVHVLVLSRVPHHSMEMFLRPSCPLYNIRFGEFVRCDKEFVAYLANTFTSSLETFEYYEEDGDFEQELISLVECSSQLCRLVYCGKISIKHVIHLAELRGAEWQVLHLARKNIYTVPKNANEPEIDGDTVIAKNSSGEYVLVNMLKFHEQTSITSNGEEEQIMIDRVSQKLGRKWFPDSDM